MHTRELIDAIMDDNKEKANAVFADIMQGLARDAVEVAKPEIANTVFNQDS